MYEDEKGDGKNPVDVVENQSGTRAEVMDKKFVSYILASMLIGGISHTTKHPLKIFWQW